MASKNSTDKVLLKACGLSMVKFAPHHIRPFFFSMSEDTMRELDVVYRIDPLTALLSVVDSPTSYAILRDGKPLAIIGIESEGTDMDKLWAMFSDMIPLNYHRFVRATPALLRFIYATTESVCVDVWSESLGIQNWLTHVGFLPKFILTTKSGHELLRFVRCGPSQHEDYSGHTSRPVRH